MSAEQLRDIGQQLYGDRWQTPLGSSGPRTESCTTGGAFGFRGGAFGFRGDDGTPVMWFCPWCHRPIQGLMVTHGHLGCPRCRQAIVSCCEGVSTCCGGHEAREARALARKAGA